MWKRILNKIYVTLQAFFTQWALIRIMQYITNVLTSYKYHACLMNLFFHVNFISEIDEVVIWRFQTWWYLHEKRMENSCSNLFTYLNNLCIFYKVISCNIHKSSVVQFFHPYFISYSGLILKGIYFQIFRKSLLLRK